MSVQVFRNPSFDNHEQVVFFYDEPTHLKAIIAIHNTNLGPALGGCRMWAYENEDMALEDVLRLSRGMTYKAAIAKLPLGGGKSVIIGDSRKVKTPQLMQAMGRAVDRLGGRYIIAEDVGTSVEDMVEVNKNTKHVVGLPAKGDAVGGDPSPVTAYGVFMGMKAAVKHRLGADSVGGLKVAVQGLGHVGYTLCKHLVEEGAKIFVTDVREDIVQKAVDELGATAVGLDDIYDLEVDVFAPCALGAVLNDKTIDRLKVAVVAGAANNQLSELRHGDILQERNVLYAPDYVINAGGLINVHYEHMARLSGNVTQEEVMGHVEEIYNTTMDIFKRADAEKVATGVAADRIAEARFMNKPANSNGGDVKSEAIAG